MSCLIINCYLNICLVLLFITNTYAQTNSNTSTLPIASKPNILFILIDDLGWYDIGYHASWSHTPNIDNLAQQYGLQLNNYYVQSICSASRSALLSGRYPIKTGMHHKNLNPNDPYGLPLNFTLLSQDLQTKAGYDTYLFGKWNLGYFNEQYTPTFRGFNTFYGFYNDMEDFNNHTVSIVYNGNTTERYDLFHNMQPVNDSMLNTYSTYIYRNKTIDAFRQYNANSDANKKPLFIYLSLQNLNSPLQAPKNITDSINNINKTERKIKAAKAVVVDNIIGEIIQYINDTGLWDNLLIIFSTDNGAGSTDGGSNYPLRGAKGTLWEGGVRGTCFISGGYLNASQYGLTDELIHITDFYPTIMDIVNVTATDSNELDGKSFINVLKNGAGKSNRNETLLNIDPVNCNNSYNICGAIRIENWKLIIGNNGNSVTHLDNICDGIWCSNTDNSYSELNKPIQCNYSAATEQIQTYKNKSVLQNQCPYNGEPCLFNIATDPCEFFDVKLNHPQILNKTIQRLQFYMTQTVTPLSILNAPMDPVNMYSDANNSSKYWTPWKNNADMIMWNTPATTSNPSSTSVTTHGPTNNPSSNPTVAPTTIAPTVAIVSTVMPSQTPTISPSSINTTNPTLAPTIIPTKTPSISPVTPTTTLLPTKSPTLYPTQYPTQTPSNSPLFTSETRFPTKFPSAFPSQLPSKSPSILTTMSPTNFPSIDPTNSPSEDPSMSPTFTFNPSKAPTSTPSESPIHTHSEVQTTGKKKYMTAFYLISIFSIVGCLCLICIGILWKKHRNKNRMRHRRLQDSLKGIELKSYIRPPRGGGEYSGLLD